MEAHSHQAHCPSFPRMPLFRGYLYSPKAMQWDYFKVQGFGQFLIRLLSPSVTRNQNKGNSEQAGAGARTAGMRLYTHGYYKCLCIKPNLQKMLPM